LGVTTGGEPGWTWGVRSQDPLPARRFLFPLPFTDNDDVRKEMWLMAQTSFAVRRWLALVGIGAVACTACCVFVPILITAGVAGSGLLIVGAEWLEPTGYGLIAVGVVGLVTSIVRNRLRHTTE
jgi:hypothetical protein